METRKPDFKAIQGISVWQNKDKKGNTYLNISVLGMSFRAFPVK